MELNSVWDEGFFSMVSDELDYEFDENDLFANAEYILQETIKHENSAEFSSFMQPDLDNKSSLDDKKILVQAELEEKPILENRHVLEDPYFIRRQDFVNSTFSNCSVKSEPERRDSTNNINNIVDSQIIIDARMFLDPYNNSVAYSSIPNVNDSKPNSTKEVSITSHNQSQQTGKHHNINSTKSIHKSQSKKKKFDNFVIPNVDKNYQSIKKKDIIKIDGKKKHSSNAYKEKFEKRQIADLDKRKYKEHTNILAKTENKRKEIQHFLPTTTLSYVDADRKCKPNNDNSTSTKRKEYFSAAFSNEGKKYKSDQEKTNDKLDIKKKKLISSVSSNIDKNYDNIRNKVDSEIQKNKKFVSVHSISADKKHKLKRRKIEDEPNVLFSQKESNKEDTFDKAVFQENFKLNIDKSKFDIGRSILHKPKVSKNSLKVKKPKFNDKKTHWPKDHFKDELLLDRKNILPIKLESNHLADVQPTIQPISNNYLKNVKPKDPKKDEFPQGRKNILKCENSLEIEPTLKNNLLNPKFDLKKFPDDIIHSIPIKPKDEVFDKKSVLGLNFLHLPKAKIVLKKLTEADLKSPASLLIRVKTEINENVSQKLRSQGRAKNKDFIHRYCCKCKSLQVDRSGLSKTKNCENCDSLLIYLCVKCNDKEYVGYYHLQRHLKKCRGSGETKPQHLESIVIRRCTQCTFRTTRAEIMASHVKNKGHKADREIDVNAIPKSPKVRVKREVPNELKIPRTKYAKLIVKQNDTSVASITERYCITCNMPQSSKTRKPKEPCYRCKTQLQLRCLKCSLKCSSYHAMLHHLRSKCQPNEFKCAKCNYTNSIWLLMQLHVMEKHCNKSSKLGRTGKSKKKCREIFNCTLCSFQTHYQHNVIRHMKRVHKK